METADLKKVRHIGASRMKSLNDFGIITLEQLCETPTEKLAEIPTIGKHYAKLIKDAVMESYRVKPEKGASEKPATGKEKKLEELKENFIKQINVLQTCLKRMDEDFKPPGKKKVLESYDEFRKKSITLMKRIDGLDKIAGDLSKKGLKNINKRAAALNKNFKKAGEKIKKKRFQRLSREIQSFSKMLKKYTP